MESAMGQERRMTIGRRAVSIFPSAAAGRPVIYLNTFAEEGRRVYARLHEQGCPDYTLVAISGLEWNHDMAPWEIPPLSKRDTPCTGGAGSYLRLLLDTIMPEAEKQLNGTPSWRGMAGYSLAGLFAVYAMYQTDAFSRIASMSGSLWFPGIKEYIFTHEEQRRPDCMYFSLGDRESKTRNPFLKCVRQNTEEIEAFYRGKGIDTVFELNPGNHFQDAVERSAAGIAWILSR